jgi:predicted transcriptional regulator
MIFPPISSIKQRRKLLNLTQKDLANKTGLSQSLIAKLEAEKIKTSYEVMVKIFNYLDNLEKKSEKTCSQVMKPHPIALEKHESVKKAVELMKKKSISQIPILEKNNMVGSISENKIYDLLSESSKEKVFNKKLEEVMDEPFPTLNKDSPLSLSIPLLKFTNALIILERGKIVGIITKSDII